MTDKDENRNPKRRLRMELVLLGVLYSTLGLSYIVLGLKLFG